MSVAVADRAHNFCHVLTGLFLAEMLVRLRSDMFEKLPTFDEFHNEVNIPNIVISLVILYN